MAARTTIIATTRLAAEAKLEAITSTGAEIVLCREKEGKVSLRDLVRRLAKRGILYVLLEGGSRLITSALEAGIVDKVAFFYAPKIIGGSEARSVVEGKGARYMKDTLAVTDISIRRFGNDIFVEGYIGATK